MAARNTTLLMVCCTYEGKKFNVQLREGMRTSDVISEAAKIINVDPKRLSALWCGQVIKPDMPIQDAIANRSATDLHLVQLGIEEVKRHTAEQHVVDDAGQIYVYCKECEGMAEGRQVLICSKCNQKNKFIRQQQPAKMFEVEYKIDGTCTQENCPSNKQVVTAQVRYECKGCNSGAAVLKHVQRNDDKIPCIKCGNARGTMFVFCCDALHTICLMCFSGYCQMQINNKKFQIFDNIGYSVSCPAPSCPDAPVRDPHHFYLVNEKFYQMFQFKAAECYQPLGNNIFCTCFTEIEVGSSSSSGDGAAASKGSEEQGGLWWSRKSKAKKAATATKKKASQRRRVTCPNTECGKAYCVECKSFWHDGDCVERTEPSKDDVFQIYEPYERASRWPKPS